MKLIVDVSKSDYEVIINHCDDYLKSLYSEPEERCILAVKNGIPLPKGHGKLMILSEDAVKREYTSLGSSCQSWISDVGLSNATVAIIEEDGEVTNGMNYIPFLIHKEMDIPISECKKAYDIAIDYLRSQGRLKG